MTLPAFLDRLPELDLPFDSSVVSSHAIRSDEALLVVFTFHQDMVLPDHSHGAQWGMVLEGEIEFTIGGDTATYRPGDSYNIPAGVVHGARIKAGTKVMDMFEEADRYPLKPR